ncbi:MAG: hypothetical protein OIN83_09160 [Candidatus Methanoperedens sp.]|nr:hypothetical protein [Candidatus Methanoperedens sp.]
MERTCCLPDDKKITMVRIGDTMVGLASVGEVFEKIYQGKKKPEDIERIELVQELTSHNYVPEEAWDEYAEALIIEYENYYNKKILRDGKS